MSGSAGTTRFPGLNGLRALAALLVVVGHIPMNQASLGLPNTHWGALFYRGEPAVTFFFTLSGFLITYLLIAERERTGSIDVRAFYVRRMLRIWPLYFLVIGSGLLFYNALLPWLGIPYRVEYSLPAAIALYVLFLPHLMSSLYNVGGILNPTWSIGVEEQYYLLWAPLVRRARRVRSLCLWVLFGSFSAAAVVQLFRPELEPYTKFFLTMKFHFMAAGGLAARSLFDGRDSLLARPAFRVRWVQVACWVLLLEFYVTGLVVRNWLAIELFQLLLYPWLILEVAANRRRLFSLDARWLDALGEASYGIYMFHMFVVYATSWAFLRMSWWQDSPRWTYLLAYYGMAVGGTVLVALLSRRYFEAPFLRLQGRFRRNTAGSPVRP
jgi:peptidoglycan/LPS O-acetylase OafA/YrhL